MKKTEEFQRIQTIALFGIIIVVGLLFWQLISPYIYAIFWAAVIAALFYPVYSSILERVRRESVAAVLTVILAILLVMLPLILVGGLLVDQTIDLINYALDPRTIDTAEQWLSRITQYPFVEQYAADLQIIERLQASSSAIAQWLLANASAASQNTIQFIISLFIMIYTLYFFLKDGANWLQRFMELLPFGDDKEKLLYSRFVSTARATLKGTLLIGIIQGAIGGIFLWITGVPSVAILTILMIFFAIIPAVGPALVLIPAAIYFAVTAAWWQAILLVIAMLIIGVIDNILRPPLVGKDLQMHPVLILFATIGGIAVYGISGVVIGPMIAAFFFSLLSIYETKYKVQLEQQG